jgi:uncharacterized protein YfbU (UPF0304 family)
MAKIKMPTKEETQKRIDSLKSNGFIFEFEELGKSFGPLCECCGKTGINFILVYSYRKGEKDHDDPGSQVEFTFGKTCLKKFKF